jgi:PP-loop superfamily ATP-utilizing enzyme
VRSLGFSVFRVRHIEQVVTGGISLAPVARVQIAPEEMCKLPETSSRLEAGLRAAGYAEVEIDPQGYRAS